MMNNNPHFLHNTNTPTQILKQTTHIITTHIPTFLFLTTLLLTFHSNVHTCSHYLSTLIDRDPSFKSLLSRLDFANSSPLRSRRNVNNNNNNNNNAFLHLSRVGTLDDDFFTGESESESRSSFHSSVKKRVVNSTVLNLSMFYSFPSLVTFNNVGFKNNFNNYDAITSNGNGNDNVSGVVESGSKVEVDDYKDATSLIYLAGVLSVTYTFVVMSFIVTYTWVSGILFVRVLDWVCDENGSGSRGFFGVLWDGSSVGLKRVSGFVLMKWAVRDALAQLLGIYYFGEVEDQYAFFKVFVGMKFMPFSNVTPWVKGYEWESAGFAVVWFLSDFVIGFLFAVDGWVAIADGRRGGREIVKEGCHLLGTMFCTGFEIRWSEAIVCGSVGRWVMRRYVGEVFTFAFQSFMEVYFMVAWLVFYLAARCKDEASVGRTFGKRELEGLLAVAR